jgi:hypothetical protein
MQGRCSDHLQALWRDINITQARRQTKLLAELRYRFSGSQTSRVWRHTYGVDPHGLSNEHLTFRARLKIEAHGVG